MKTNIFYMFFMVMIFLFPVQVYAQPAVNTTPITSNLPSFESIISNSNSGRISVLSENQRAPFAGILFDNSAVATIYTERQFFARQCSLFIEREVAETRNELTLQNNNLNATITRLRQELTVSNQSRTSEVQRLSQSLSEEERRNRSFFSSNSMTWLGIGITGGFLISGITFAILYTSLSVGR